MKTVITFYFIVLSCQFAQGQTGANTFVIGGERLYFNNDSLCIEEGPELAGLSTYTESNYQGNLQFYCGGFGLYNRLGAQIYSPAQNEFIAVAIGFRLNDSTYLSFQKLYQQGALFFDSYLIKQVVVLGKNGIRVEPDIEVLETDSVFELTVSPDTLGGNWLLVRLGKNRLNTYYYNNSTLHLKKTQQTFLTNDRGGVFRDIREGVKCSPSGNKVVFQSGYTLDSDKDGKSDVYVWNVNVADFNKATGLLENQNLLIDSTSTSFGFGFQFSEFSSNDSFLYLSHTTRDLASPNTTFSSCLQVYLPSSKFSTLYTSNDKELYENDIVGFSSGIKLFIDGKMYLMQTTYGAPYKRQRYLLSTIENSNSTTPVFSKFARVTPKHHAFFGQEFGYSKYNYIRVKPQYKYDCQAHVTFLDKCDYALPNTTVTYFSEDVAGNGVLIPRGQNPSITYTKDGDYLCKVILKSHEGTYKEIHYDTLKIRIPEKPVAAFKAADTVICAYTTLQFTNQSTTDTVHATNGEKWVWTFGDGTSKTVLSPESKSPVSHSYKTPGTYTVSLFYSNGFCDSTLVKNQYITVVDAPAPGFTVDNIRGCSPFTVNVTDTVTKNTIRKEYNYYDGRGWIDVPVNQVNFSQTYPDAGTYWITQRLYGYTGCVTQLDSVQIFVTPGFTAFDTSHITNATYQDIPAYPKAKEIVSLTWPCLEDAAVRYVSTETPKK